MHLFAESNYRIPDMCQSVCLSVNTAFKERNREAHLYVIFAPTNRLEKYRTKQANERKTNRQMNEQTHEKPVKHIKKATNKKTRKTNKQRKTERNKQVTKKYRAKKTKFLPVDVLCYFKI